MNEENNNIDISFENEDTAVNSIPDDIVVPGNIIGDDDIFRRDDFEGPIIVSPTNEEDNEEVVEEVIEEVTGPIIVNSEEEEMPAIEQVKEEKATSFKQIEDEIRNLYNEKEEIERNIESLNRRKNELEILIRSKQEELDYKKEVEVTTDKLKTYIRDLEVKPGAVRDALAALINNMDN